MLFPFPDSIFINILYMRRILILSVIIIFSCTRFTREEKMIKNTLGTKIYPGIFDYVQHQDQIIAFTDFRKQYKYIFLVYLQNGCAPCYPKYIEWQTRMKSLVHRDDITVLFIYQGQDFNSFLIGLKDTDPEYDTRDDLFFIAIDSEGSFQSENPEISDGILNSSLLIDEENKVRLIGAPFASTQMTDLFFRITRE
jgi:hypothetical protein